MTRLILLLLNSFMMVVVSLTPTECLAKEFLSLTNRDGKKILAKIVKIDGDYVLIQRKSDGKQFNLNIADLNDESRLLISEPEKSMLIQDESQTVGLNEFAEKYNIVIKTKKILFPESEGISGKMAPEKSLGPYIAMFIQEFSVYPPKLIKMARLKNVVFCEDLSWNGQHRAAIPDFKNQTLFLDVTRGNFDKFYQRKTMHHEFFHIIDNNDDGELYEDKRWSALNPKVFRYGNGGDSAQRKDQTSVITDKFPGFLNHYSTTAVEEDKAEVFANLLVDHVGVSKRAASDAVINSKIDNIKKLLEEFCPEMNSIFWDSAKSKQIGNQ